MHVDDVIPRSASFGMFPHVLLCLMPWVCWIAKFQMKGVANKKRHLYLCPEPNPQTKGTSETLWGNPLRLERLRGLLKVMRSYDTKPGVESEGVLRDIPSTLDCKRTGDNSNVTLFYILMSNAK